MVARWSGAAEFDDQPGEVRDALVASWNDWLGYLERQATKAIELKQIATSLTPRQVVMALCGLASAADTMVRLLGHRDALRDAERAFDQLFPRRPTGTAVSQEVPPCLRIP